MFDCILVRSLTSKLSKYNLIKDPGHLLPLWARANAEASRS